MNFINQTNKNDVIDVNNYENVCVVEKLGSDDELRDELRFLTSINKIEDNFFYKAIISNVLVGNNSLSLFNNVLSTKYGNLNYSIVYQNKKHITNEDLFNRGLTNFYFGDYKKAVNDFDLTSQISYNEMESLYYKSLSLGALNEFEKAIVILNSLIDRNSRDYRYWNDKGSFLIELNCIKEAHFCFDKSILLSPNSYNWSNKAILFQYSNKLQDALDCFDNAIDLNPNDIFPVLGKAKIYLQLEDFENAELCFDIAEEIDPCDLECLIEKGKFLLFQKEYGGAIEYFDRAIKFDHNSDVLWMLKAMAYKHLNRHLKAEICVDMAHKINPNISISFDELFN